MIRIKDTNLLTRVKLVLVALMVLCLLPMPYGFYNLVRFISMIGFAILAGYAYQEGRNKLAVVYGSLLLMFQPFIKLALDGEIWNTVDIAVALFLIITMVKDKAPGTHK